MTSPSSSNRPAAAPKPPFRWGRLVMFLSLAFNLAVLGVVGGAWLGGPEHRRPDFVARDIGFGLFNDALTEDDRKALRRAFAEAKPDFRAERGEMRADLQTLLAVLRAEPLDADALRAMLQKGVDRNANRQALGQKVLVERLIDMPAAQRVALADRLEQSLKRRPKREREAKD